MLYFHRIASKESFSLNDRVLGLYMEILPIVLGLAAGICIGTGIFYLFIGFRRWDESPQNLTISLPLKLILELEQNALLLYRR